MLKLRNDDGSKSRNWEDGGSKLRNWETMMALNAETENAALKAKLKKMVALNAKTEDTTLNAKLERDDGSEPRTGEKWWLWMPN